MGKILSFEDYLDKRAQKAFKRKLAEYAEQKIEGISRLEEELKTAFYEQDDSTVMRLGLMLDEIDRPNAYGYIGLATLAFHENRYDDARKCVDSALEDWPDNKEALILKLSFMYNSCEGLDFDVDEEFIQHAFELYPDDADILELQLKICIDVFCDFDKGHYFYKRLKKVDPVCARTYDTVIYGSSRHPGTNRLNRIYLEESGTE